MFSGEDDLTEHPGWAGSSPEGAINKPYPPGYPSRRTAVTTSASTPARSSPSIATRGARPSPHQLDDFSPRKVADELERGNHSASDRGLPRMKDPPVHCHAPHTTPRTITPCLVDPIARRNPRFCRQFSIVSLRLVRYNPCMTEATNNTRQ